MLLAISSIIVVLMTAFIWVSYNAILPWYGLVAIGMAILGLSAVWFKIKFPKKITSAEHARKLMISVLRVFIAAANADGRIHPAEGKAVAENYQLLFRKTLSVSWLDAMIEEYRYRTPELIDAIEADMSIIPPKMYKPIFDAAERIMRADGSLDQREEDFLQYLKKLFLIES